MTVLIDATLFRIDQLHPFMNKLGTYRDEKLLLSFDDNLWLELRKPAQPLSEDYSGDKPYFVSQVGIAEDIPPDAYAFQLARLFEGRDVRVKVETGAESGFDPVEPISITELMFRLNGFYDGHKRPYHGKKELLNTVRLWRLQQFMALSNWIDSYRDPSLEVSLLSTSVEARLKLEKPTVPACLYPGDHNYHVTGVATDAENIFAGIAKLFTAPPVNVYVSNTRTQAQVSQYEPTLLEKFVLQCGKYIDDSKRR